MKLYYGQKGEKAMIKKFFEKKGRALLVAAVVALLLCAVLTQPVAQAVSYEVQYINTVLVFLFLTSLCVIDSSFTDLIRTDSDGLFYTAE